MGASSFPRRLRASLRVTEWAWWKLPRPLRAYVATVPLFAITLAVFVASETTWHGADLRKFALLLACAFASVAATPRIAYTHGALVRDFIAVWVLPVAILLPPVYAMVTPIPLYALTQLRVHRGIIHHRVFTVSAMGLCYGLASMLFRAFPASFAGARIGNGPHALTWVLAVALCEIVGGRGHNFLIVIAVKLSSPVAKIVDQELSREALQADLAEFDL